MIYKNNVSITTLYLNGRKITKGYKGEVQFLGYDPEPLPADLGYFCLTAIQDTSVSFSNNNAIDLKYSYNGRNWTQWDFTTFALQEGKSVYFKGNNDSGLNQDHFNINTGQYTVSGNAHSLLYGDNYESNNTVPQQGFYGLFSGNTALVDASNLILPATTLASNCYTNMFYGCTSLTEAPELPATALAASCYKNMFEGCTSLTEAPELPALTMQNHCYDGMFFSCTSLTTAPALPATSLASSCYSGMFGKCSSFVNAPILPATTLAGNCYNGMFYECTSLTTAPELPATELVSNCYKMMFQGCSSLNYIKAMFTTTPTSQTTSAWVRDVASTGTFVKNADASWDVTSENGVPSGWTVITEQSSLPTLSYDSNTFTVSATGSGTVTLFIDGIQRNSPYTFIQEQYIDRIYSVEARNKETGKSYSSVTMTITVPSYQTEDPVITYNDSTNTVTATGNGTVLLYKNNVGQDTNDYVQVNNPYTLSSAETEAGATTYFKATAQETGKQISSEVFETVSIPSTPTGQTYTLLVENMANQESWQTTQSVSNFTYENFNFESSNMKYYTTGGSHLRLYANNNTLTIRSYRGNITSVTFTTMSTYKFTSSDSLNYTFTDNGDSTQTFSNINSSQFTLTNTSSTQRRWTQVEITVEGDISVE